MGCEGCEDGMIEMDYKGHSKICVKQDDFYDCQATAAATVAGANMMAKPQGPEGCVSCVMAGDAESFCLECDHANGWELNKTTLTCYEKAVASDDEWMEDCNNDMVTSCDICRAKEYVDHSDNSI